MKLFRILGLTLYVVGVSMITSCIDFSDFGINVFLIAVSAMAIGGSLWGNIEGRE